MASKAGRGSILFKIIIALLSVVLILVIKIPDLIWDEEKTEKNQSQFNIESIYETEKYFFRLTGKYTADKDELLAVVKNDSTLFQTQKRVNYTQELAKSIGEYLSNDLVNTYLTIDQIIQNIISDLITNERYIKINQEILAESENANRTP